MLDLGFQNELPCWHTVDCSTSRDDDYFSCWTSPVYVIGHCNYQIGVNLTKSEIPIIKSGHFARSYIIVGRCLAYTAWQK